MLSLTPKAKNMLRGAYSVIHWMTPRASDAYTRRFHELKAEAAACGVPFDRSFIDRTYRDIFLGQLAYAGLMLGVLGTSVLVVGYSEVAACAVALCSPLLTWRVITWSEAAGLG